MWETVWRASLQAPDATSTVSYRTSRSPARMLASANIGSKPGSAMWGSRTSIRGWILWQEDLIESGEHEAATEELRAATEEVQ